MQKSKLLKAITLCFFIILISGFVAYRGGAFKLSSNDAMAENLDGSAVDSPPVKKTYMHSSKSMRVIDPEEKKKQAKNDSIRRREDMMSSSKSGGIFSESDLQPNQTSTPQAKATVSAVPITTRNPNQPMMNSSKSGGIVSPKDVKTFTSSPASQEKSQQPANQNKQQQKNNQPNQSNQAPK